MAAAIKRGSAIVVAIFGGRCFVAGPGKPFAIVLGDAISLGRRLAVIIDAHPVGHFLKALTAQRALLVRVEGELALALDDFLTGSVGMILVRPSSSNSQMMKQGIAIAGISAIQLWRSRRDRKDRVSFQIVRGLGGIMTIATR
jgi:hypothetical protein